MLETPLAGEGEADLVGHCAAEGALGRDKKQSETDPLRVLTLSDKTTYNPPKS